MNTPLFTGVCTALVTPFSDGQVNFPMLETLLQRQMDAGIRAIVLCGTTGESPTLSDEEKCKIFQHAKTYCGSRCTLLAGTGSNSTAHAVELSRRAEDAGADGLLVVSPYYNKATPDGLYKHYQAIADAVRIPIVLYNVPSRTGVDVPTEVYARLSALPNIAGVKEASADITKAARTLAACPDSFSLWTGNDPMTVPVMALGGAGVISVASNVAPVRMKAMADAALSGSYQQAARIQRDLLELMDALFCAINPIPAKCAMKLLGYDCGECRMPLTALLPEQEKRLKTILKENNFQ